MANYDFELVQIKEEEEPIIAKKPRLLRTRLERNNLSTDRIAQVIIPFDQATLTSKQYVQELSETLGSSKTTTKLSSSTKKRSRSKKKSKKHARNTPKKRKTNNWSYIKNKALKRKAALAAKHNSQLPSPKKQPPKVIKPNAHTKPSTPQAKCQFCLKTFAADCLQRHIERHHRTTSEMLICDLCGSFFLKKRLIMKHIEIHIVTVKCRLCKKRMHPTLMSQHMAENHQNDDKFFCKICPKTFRTSEKLKLHKMAHRKFKCEECGKRFMAKSYLKCHLKDFHDHPGSLTCEQCPKKFFDVKILKRHQESHKNSNQQKRHLCQKCGYSTNDKSNFKNHEKSHKKQEAKYAKMENPLPCNLCTTFCRDQATLSRHIKSVHPKELYQCDLCGISSKYKNNLIKHVMRHLGKIEYVHEGVNIVWLD